jgi:hypothetical protein
MAVVYAGPLCGLDQACDIEPQERRRAGCRARADCAVGPKSQITLRPGLHRLRLGC